MKIHTLFIAITLSLFALYDVHAATERPNIVLVLCDDLGYADVGFNGSTDITTPELDRLAHAGVVFSSAYVAHPFCGPSRMGLFSGRYPHEFGAPYNLPHQGEDLGKGIPATETMISTVLQDAGYYTGAVGKWHMGDVAEFHPNNRGFDDYYGFLGGGHEYFPSRYRPIYERQLKNGVKHIREYVRPLEHNGKEVRETEYITDALSREAARFVREASEKEKPFFLYLAYNAPHSPLQAKEEDMQRFSAIDDEKRRTYAAMVYAVDRGVGELVESLKATGEYENTLIVFLSDNGGKLSLGANNFPLREGKGSTCEGGYRVPMFFHWPERIPSGGQFPHPVSALDFYPTFAGLADATIPSGKKIDGKDIWDNLLAGDSPRPGEMIYALRHRDGYSDVGARLDQWKICRTYQGPWKLFNVESDMAESRDVSDQHPQRLREMVSLAEKWSRGHIEPKWFDDVKVRNSWNRSGMPHYESTFRVVDKESR